MLIFLSFFWNVKRRRNYGTLLFSIDGSLRCRRTLQERVRWIASAFYALHQAATEWVEQLRKGRILPKDAGRKPTSSSLSITQSYTRVDVAGMRALMIIDLLQWW